MRPVSCLLAAVVLATAACGEVIDPSTADMTGIFIRVDSTSSAGLRLGVRSNNPTLVALPPDYVDYLVTVTGKIFIQTDGGYRQIGPAEAPANSKLLLWTTGEELRSQPGQIKATRVVVPSP